MFKFYLVHIILAEIHQKDTSLHFTSTFSNFENLKPQEIITDPESLLISELVNTTINWCLSLANLTFRISVTLSNLALRGHIMHKWY